MAFDLEIGAATVFMESSSEGEGGQVAVAWVLVNRMRSGHWGNTIASVCLAPFQFSSWNTSDPNRKRVALLRDDDPVLVGCQRAMREALDGVSSDPTGNATFYFADGIDAPGWASAMRPTVKIGKHNFFADQ